jgi:hypothetical protein
MRTLVQIRVHYNRLYTQAEQGSVARICYLNIWNELRQHDTKREAAKSIRFLRDAAPETDRH